MDFWRYEEESDYFTLWYGRHVFLYLPLDTPLTLLEQAVKRLRRGGLNYDQAIDLCRQWHANSEWEHDVDFYFRGGGAFLTALNAHESVNDFAIWLALMR